MRREKVKIPKPEINPLGLSLREREVCLDVVRSLERCIQGEAYRLREEEDYSHNESLSWARYRVFDAAKRLLRGTSRNSKVFWLTRDVPDEDLEFIRQHFGVEAVV